MKCILRLLGMSVVTMLAIPVARTQPAWVEPGGYANSFSALPPAGEWSTYTYPGAPANAYDLTNLAQSLAASAVNSNLVDGSPADPATQRTLAFWTSGGGGYVCTRPAGNRCTLLMVTLMNHTGTNATAARIEYDLAIKAAQTEPDYPGLRAFYSLSGQSNSWVAIPELSSAAPVSGRLTAGLSLGAPWMQGQALHVLWVDDNANIALAEPGYALDNVFVGVTAGVPDSTSLACLVDAPANNAALLVETPVLTAATVFQGTPPYTVEYFTNRGAGNLEYVSAGSSATAPYPVSLGSLPVGTYNIFSVVTDSAPTPASATSATNTFSVADPILVTLTAPAQGATLDYLTPVEGAATVSGGTPPYAVQYYVDNVPRGSPVTAEPYAQSLGFLLPGERAIKVIARDARGWGSTSLVHTVHVIGPLGVTLTPTNGTAYNYGQWVTLTASVLYGTAPHTVTFYAADQLLGAVSAPPFTWDLGMLPVGSYTSRVQVVDSAAPTPAQAASSTNVFTIRENPLVASLSSPADGQQWPDYRRKTDEQGSFSFDPKPGAHTVVAVGPAGLGRVRCFDFSNPLEIRLQPWGRIEGNVRTRDGQWADRKVHWLPTGHSTRWQTLFCESDRSAARSDAAGRFTLEHIPPGGGWVAIDAGPGTAPTLSPSLEVKPGTTVQVQIGGLGRPVTGRLVAPPGLEIRSWSNHVKFARVQADFEWDSYQMPRDLSGNAAERWRLEFEDTEAGRTCSRSQYSYDFTVEADGAFTLPEVLPGK